MPQASQGPGVSTVVAQFQGFVTGAAGNALITRAAQNCIVNRVSAGQFQILLNNVAPDDCNFMVQVHQFIYAAGQSGYATECAFPPVATPATPPNINNYINLGFYSSAGTPVDPNVYGLFNIVVSSCNDGLVGLTNPATGTPFRTPGNP